MQKASYGGGWVREHIVPRLRALINLVLHIDYLVATKDVGGWAIAWLLYLGIVGSVLTALICGATRGVIFVANNVLRPHALPIISPELEHYFISWPQLAIGLGFHAHIITALYFAAPAYTVALILAAIGDERSRQLLSPRGATLRDIFDHVLFVAVLILGGAAGILAPKLSPHLPAAAWQLLAPHIALSIFWLVYSLSQHGLAYRTIGLALSLAFTVIFNSTPREVFSDLRVDPWCSLLLKHYIPITWPKGSPPASTQ